MISYNKQKHVTIKKSCIPSGKVAISLAIMHLARAYPRHRPTKSGDALAAKPRRRRRLLSFDFGAQPLQKKARAALRADVLGVRAVKRKVSCVVPHYTMHLAGR